MTSRDEAAAWNEAPITDFQTHEGQITTGPIACTRDDERQGIAGSNRGLPTGPAWLANLRGHPEVTVEVDPKKPRARAVVTSGAERRRLFDAHAAAMPTFADYERTTEREIPVVTLERIDPA